MMSRPFTIAIVLAVASATGAAGAQTTGSAGATGGVGMGLPTAAATAGESDHDTMVGRFAIGYLGKSDVPIGNFASPNADTPDNRGAAAAPILGARYWISPLLGVEAGLGFGFGTGKNKIDSTVSSEQRIGGVSRFLFHAGVPFALAGGKHYSFQLMPEGNIGFASQSLDGSDAGNDVRRTNGGFLLELGARGGAEIHFGFIGIPQLSLCGTIGVRYVLERRKTRTEPAQGSATEILQTRASFETAVYEKPWDIFTSSIAAFYYF